MSDKYVVSQEFMNKLEEWKNTLDSNEDKPLVGWLNIRYLPETVYKWWLDDEVPDEENNNRLSTILNWVNGEDIFEVEKPKRWVVRSKETDSKGSHLYVFVSKDDALCYSCLGLVNATHFATKEEAQSWANSHQEVVEV